MSSEITEASRAPGKLTPERASIGQVKLIKASPAVPVRGEQPGAERSAPESPSRREGRKEGRKEDAG